MKKLLYLVKKFNTSVLCDILLVFDVFWNFRPNLEHFDAFFKIETENDMRPNLSLLWAFVVYASHSGC